MLGMIPDREILKMSVYLQAEMNTEMMLEILKSGAVSEFQQTEMTNVVKSIEEIPAFIIETLMGAYQKGMRFVFDIQNYGWEKVSQLYADAPVSTEQILYPEKWLNGEKPFKYEWPSFNNEAVFRDWEVIDVNTIGEIQWRIIFSEYEMGYAAKEASAGWDGDVYAVLKKKNSDDLLLLLYTSWDTDKDANEFAENYENLLKIKYINDIIEVKVKVVDKDVLIIEGGPENVAFDVLGFMSRIRKLK